MKINCDCEFKPNLGSIFECKFKYVTITVRNTVIECNEEFSKNKLDEVHIITFNDSTNKIKFFPKMADYFKQIRHIQIINAGLTEITQTDLARYPLLYRLNLEKNKLKLLGQKLFVNNIKLMIINLNNNEIEKIHENTFDGVEKLQTLRLTNNSCINHDIIDRISSVKLLIDLAKIKCNKNRLHDHENDELEVAVFALTGVNIFQFIIIVAGITVWFIQQRKVNSHKKIANQNLPKAVMFENTYEEPEDIYIGSIHDYVEPVGTPSRPDTVNRSETFNYQGQG